MLGCRILCDLLFREVTLRDRNFGSFLRSVYFDWLCNAFSRFNLGFSGNYFRIGSFGFELFPTFGLLDKIVETSQILRIFNPKFLAINFQPFQKPVKILRKIQVISLHNKLAKPGAVVIQVFTRTLDSRNKRDKHFVQIFAVGVFRLGLRKVCMEPNFGLET